MYLVIEYINSGKKFYGPFVLLEDLKLKLKEMGINTDSIKEESIQITNIKEFDITAKQWQFIPSTIEVNEGDTVILNIKSIDVSHGIAIPNFGIDEFLSPGNEVKIEFVADNKGTFFFACSVSCGVGHSGMIGKIIVN